MKYVYMVLIIIIGSLTISYLNPNSPGFMHILWGVAVAFAFKR